MADLDWTPTWRRCTNPECGATVFACGAEGTCHWCGFTVHEFKPVIAQKATGQVAQAAKERPS